MKNESVCISCDKAALDIEMIHRFLTFDSTWAKGISMATVRESIENSLCYGLFFDRRQIGFARVVSDLATFGYLCDVFVLPAYRGNGYSKLLMRYIMDDPILSGLRRIVLVTADAHGLYRQYGFTALGQPERYMAVHRPDVYSRHCN